jgi:hypothetical protein
MKIKIERFGDCDEYGRIEEYAVVRLSGDDYGVCALDAANATARNNSLAIGRLLDILAEKGVVSDYDVSMVVDGFSAGDISFLK